MVMGTCVLSLHVEVPDSMPGPTKMSLLQNKESEPYLHPPSGEPRLREAAPCRQDQPPSASTHEGKGWAGARRTHRG